MPPFLQYLLGICAVAVAAGIAFAQFRRAGRGESGDIIKYYKEESASYKDILEKKDNKHAEEIKKLTSDFNQQIHQLTEKFGMLQGQYNAEKGMRERAEAILKDRNPETTKFMTDTVAALGEIMKFMVKLNQHMEDEKKREMHIDGTISRT